MTTRVAIAALGLCACGRGETGAHRAPEAHVEIAAGAKGVLFVGNSLTFHNDLPRTVAAVARAGGVPLDAHASTIPGGTLEAAWDAGRAAAMMRAAPWWAVVLQEQSVRPLADPAAMRAAVARFAKLARGRGARVVIYGTWPDRRDPGLSTRLDASFRRAARESGAELALTGPAWMRASRARDVVLWADDGVHPTPAGTYLAACVIYRALTGESPVGLARRTLRATTDGRTGHDVTLDARVAEALQRAAAEP